MRTGVKGRYTDYVDLDNQDSGEVQGFLSLDVDGAKGSVGLQLRAASLKEATGQDLLVLERLRRTRMGLDADWEADFEKTSLLLDGRLDWTDYLGAAHNDLDNRGTRVGVRLGRKWARTNAGFRYRRGWTEYPDPSREDFSTDNFSFGLQYALRSHLALEAEAGYTKVTWPSGEADTATGMLKATYSANEERTLVMLSVARQILPSSTGVYNTDLKVDLSLRRALNPELNGEAALTYENGQYNSGVEADRLRMWAGLSMELGRRTVSYAKVSRTVYGEASGPMPEDYTVFTLGFTYGF